MTGTQVYSLEAERTKREAARARAAKCWTALDALKPSNAQALIIAELKEDTSEPQSDCYGSKTVRRVAIGWRTGKREDFRQLRRAAAGYAPTAHLGPDAKYLDYWGNERKIEHRDNYSMGGGNWLGIDQHSGWHVRSYDLKYDGYRTEPLVLWLPGLK